MIETIQIEKCTGCGICDDVCPADVIHMEPAAALGLAPERQGKTTALGHAPERQVKATALGLSGEPSALAGLRPTGLLPVIRFREHCITCFSCEIFCPERIVDVHPSVKNRPRPW